VLQQFPGQQACLMRNLPRPNAFAEQVRASPIQGASTIPCNGLTFRGKCQLSAGSINKWRGNRDMEW